MLHSSRLLCCKSHARLIVLDNQMSADPNMIEYVNLSECNSSELISILNSDDVRKHLMPHGKFDHESLANWIKQKSVCDSLADCRVRGIRIDQQLAGWCGIQWDEPGYERAIV